MAPLGGSVAIVTGAAAGIGLETARSLVASGATVVGADVDLQVAHVMAAIGATGVVCDLARERDIAALVDGVVDANGGVDVVVNNAGLGRHDPVHAIRTEDLDLMWAVNVRGAVLLTRAAWPHLAARGGQLVNVVSTAGLRGEPGESAYCATKFALRGFTEAVAEEGRVAGVRVHGIYPAGVDTAFWDAATADGPGVDPKERFLRPEDVASVIVEALAASPASHRPEVVVRAVADADLERIEAKLARFHR